MKSEKDIVKDYREIREEYAFNPDIFCEDEPRVRRVKEIIDTRLSQVDKTIILLYVDCHSYRKLGARMGLSHMTIRKEVLRILDIIREEYGKDAVLDATSGIEAKEQNSEKPNQCAEGEGESLHPLNGQTE